MSSAIRGAITCANTKEDIKNATLEMMNAIIEENNLSLNEISFVNFSATKDLDCVYPAKYLREYLDFSDIPMMCYQEMYVENSLKSCLRVLVVLNSNKDNIKHQYLRGASVLRPDLARK